MQIDTAHGSMRKCSIADRDQRTREFRDIQHTAVQERLISDIRDVPERDSAQRTAEFESSGAYNSSIAHLNRFQI